MAEKDLLFLGSVNPATPRVRDSLWMLNCLATLNRSLPPERKFFGRVAPLVNFLSHRRIVFGEGQLWRICRFLIGHAFSRFPLRSPNSLFNFHWANCGVIGGSRETVLGLVQRMNELLILTTTDDLLDMATMNFVLWRDGDRFFSGKPFTNHFKSYKAYGSEYIIHK